MDDIHKKLILVGNKRKKTLLRLSWTLLVPVAIGCNSDSRPSIDESTDSQFTTQSLESLLDVGSSINNPPPPLAEALYPESSDVFEVDNHADIKPVPQYRVPIQNSINGNWVNRISDNTIFGVGNGRAVHLYSKHQAWNANETLIDVGNFILDARTFDIVAEIPVSTARNWSNLHPDLILGIVFNQDAGTLNRLSTYNVKTEKFSILKTFDGYRDCSIGQQEGSQSKDDRYIVLSCFNKIDDQMTLISYDIVKDEVLGSKYADTNFNWASVSPSGQWILVENNSFPDENPRLLRYDLSFANEYYLGRPSHGDFGTDILGNEVYVMIFGERFSYFNLNDGNLFEISLDPQNYPIGHGHISCRNSYRPGWCYFSSNSTGRIGAIQVTPNSAQLEPWGYHHSTSSNYAATPKATVNRFGTQVLFSSDWYGNGEINDYLITHSPP